MKLFGLERDNTTHFSTPDPNGFCYSASFELYPFHEGQDKAVYKGIVNGTGPRRGDFCVVKAKLDVLGEEEDWQVTQNIVRKAHALSNDFNDLVKSRAVSFEWPVMAEMDTVSDFTPLIKLFKPHDKKLKKGELVVIENFIEGSFQTFNSTVGWVNPDSKADVTQAFSHYTWHATRELVVCGLQGVKVDSSFKLTTPTIHSARRVYGKTDGGTPGVTEFFASHRCNNICCFWPGPDVPTVRGQNRGHSQEHVGSDKLQVHGARRPHNPRRNCNMYTPSIPPLLSYVPKVPSAPTFESTRF